MHELALMKSVLSIVETETEKQGFHRVAVIRLAVGELSGVVPELLRDYFPFAAGGTVAEGARVEIRELPVTARCRACGWEGRPGEGLCPACGGDDLSLLGGREFYVESIEVE